MGDLKAYTFTSSSWSTDIQGSVSRHTYTAVFQPSHSLCNEHQDPKSSVLGVHETWKCNVHSLNFVAWWVRIFLVACPIVTCFAECHHLTECHQMLSRDDRSIHCDLHEINYGRQMQECCSLYSVPKLQSESSCITQPFCAYLGNLVYKSEIRNVVHKNDISAEQSTAWALYCSWEVSFSGWVFQYAKILSVIWIRRFT